MKAQVTNNINGKSVMLFPVIYKQKKRQKKQSQKQTQKQTKIWHDSINVFYSIGKRADNDKNNKMRECIIGSIINKCIPEIYFTTIKWKLLHDCVFQYLNILHNNQPYLSVECFHTAGRSHTFDLLIVFTDIEQNNNEYIIEFKYNATSISSTPQFVSPMKPSQYLSASYEEYFYDNYLVPFLEKCGLSIPDKCVWLKEIHRPHPECVKHLKNKYDSGHKNKQFADDISFYHECKKTAKDSIYSFIQNYDLCTDTLSDYFIKTQKNKNYMLYKLSIQNGIMIPTITLESMEPGDYKIVECIKNPELSRYECKTQTGGKLNILLRWRNGNGIAFPAFQVSYKPLTEN